MNVLQGRFGHRPDTAARFEVEPNVSNHLAWLNTVFGLQRTHMAANRTAVTLIAFGFTLAQLFQGAQSRIPIRLLEIGRHVPRDVGLLLIASGVGSLALFTWQYLRTIRYLGTGSFASISVKPGIPLNQLTCLTAFAIMLIGVLAFASICITF